MRILWSWWLWRLLLDSALVVYFHFVKKPVFELTSCLKIVRPTVNKAFRMFCTFLEVMEIIVVVCNVTTGLSTTGRIVPLWLLIFTILEIILAVTTFLQHDEYLQIRRLQAERERKKTTCGRIWCKFEEQKDVMGCDVVCAEKVLQSSAKGEDKNWFVINEGVYETKQF